MSGTSRISIYISLFVAAAVVNFALGTPFLVAEDSNVDVNVAKDETSQQAEAQADCDVLCAVYLYDKPNFYGRVLKISGQNADFRNDNFNGHVESISIRGDCSWLVYEHIKFDGTTYLLTPGRYPTPSSWGSKHPVKKISSARALPPVGSTAISLFEHAHYQGRMVTLTDSDLSLVNSDFNDKMSSLIVIGGRWILYEHVNFEGLSYPFSGPSAHSTVSSEVNNIISSVKKLP